MPTYAGTGGYDVHEGDEDVMYGLDGDDVLRFTGLTSATIYGGGGDDMLRGGPTSDYLDGSAGRDLLEGGEGNDFIYGGDGDDVGLWLSGRDLHVAFEYGLFGGSGDDYLDGGRGTDRLLGGIGDDVVLGSDGNDSGLIFASRYDSTPAGLFGADGNDHLDGGRGDDWIFGGTGNDLMIGGEGDDTFEVDDINDQVLEISGQGADVVFSYVDYTLSTHAEHLVMSYGQQTYGYGNAENNIIIGNDQANVLEGRAGYDTLTGGNGSDLFIINPGFGTDVITDFVAGLGSPDAVMFSRGLFTSFAQVMTNAAQVGTDTWIGDGAGNTVVLTGVTMSSLHPDDFGFI